MQQNAVAILWSLAADGNRKPAINEDEITASSLPWPIAIDPRVR
jgi:hypothetical protein